MSTASSDRIVDDPTAAAKWLGSLGPDASATVSPFFAAISRSARSISSRPSSAAGAGLSFALPLAAASVAGALDAGSADSIAVVAAADFFFFLRFLD